MVEVWDSEGGYSRMVPAVEKWALEEGYGIMAVEGRPPENWALEVGYSGMAEVVSPQEHWAFEVGYSRMDVAAAAAAEVGNNAREAEERSRESW